MICDAHLKFVRFDIEAFTFHSHSIVREPRWPLIAIIAMTSTWSLVGTEQTMQHI